MLFLITNCIIQTKIKGRLDLKQQSNNHSNRLANNLTLQFKVLRLPKLINSLDQEKGQKKN